MSGMKVIKTFTAALGGHSFRVTSDGKTVNYGERGPGAQQFRIKASESIDGFDAWAEQVGLFDPYRGDDPGLVYYRIMELAGNRW